VSDKPQLFSYKFDRLSLDHYTQEIILANIRHGALCSVIKSLNITVRVCGTDDTVLKSSSQTTNQN